MLACNKIDSSNTNQDPDPTNTKQVYGSLYFNGGSLDCVDLDSGRVSWSVNSPLIPLTAPAFDAGTVFTSDGYFLSAFNAQTGTPGWRINYSNTGFSSGSAYARMFASPQVIDSIVYTTGWSGATGNTTVYAANKHSGKLIWSKNLIFSQKEFNSSLPKIKIVDTRIIICGHPFDEKNKLFVLDRLTGAVLLDKDFDAGNEGIHPRFIVQADQDFAYFPDRERALIQAVDLKTGYRQKYRTI